MKYVYALALTVFFFGCVYLLLPSPSLPDLENSTRSQESGDTWQHPDQKAFYNNKTRQQVLNEMQSKFSISIFGFNLPSYRLNYRPEEAYEFVRDQTPSYYLEEILYPFRESLYVNGWEPSNSPQYRHIDPAVRPYLEYQGTVYLSKVTLRPVYSHPMYRVVIWALMFPSAWLVVYSLKRSFSRN